MDKSISLVKQISLLVEDISENAEGFDPNILLEAVYLTEADYSAPIDGDALLAELLGEGLL